MTDKNTTITIDNLIKILNQLKNQYSGDTPVVFSVDPEGNGYGIINPENNVYIGDYGGIITIYPDYNVDELDEVDGFDYDKTDEE